VTKPPTRARTCTSSTASKRPVNSSQSVTVRFTGCATVTGGAAAAACGGGLSPQPDSASALTRISGASTRSKRSSARTRFRFSVALKVIGCISPALLDIAIDGGAAVKAGGGGHRCDRLAVCSRRLRDQAQ